MNNKLIPTNGLWFKIKKILRKIFFRNLLAGISKGLGFSIGFYLITAIIIYTLQYIVKLNTRVKELMNTDIIDENRLAQEIVIFSDKSSIQEELTRLNSHISQFLNLIQSGAFPVGKKLDFIIQEMNREVNTIGSKANSTDISKCVIELKTEIEDVREQIQNIE